LAAFSSGFGTSTRPAGAAAAATGFGTGFGTGVGTEDFSSASRGDHSSMQAGGCSAATDSNRGSFGAQDAFGSGFGGAYGAPVSGSSGRKKQLSKKLTASAAPPYSRSGRFSDAYAPYAGAFEDAYSRESSRLRRAATPRRDKLSAEENLALRSLNRVRSQRGLKHLTAADVRFETSSAPAPHAFGSKRDALRRCTVGPFNGSFVTAIRTAGIYGIDDDNNTAVTAAATAAGAAASTGTTAAARANARAAARAVANRKAAARIAAASTAAATADATTTLAPAAAATAVQVAAAAPEAAVVPPETIIEESIKEVIEREDTTGAAPAVYTIAEPTTIKSGQGVQRVAIGVHQLAADMIYHCVPSVDAAAYLTVFSTI
jgi:hypothetical protein